MRKRAELFTHLQILNAQYNLAPFPKKLSFAANRDEMKIPEQFSDVSVQKSAAADLAVIDRLDEVIGDLELYLTPRPRSIACRPTTGCRAFRASARCWR